MSLRPVSRYGTIAAMAQPGDDLSLRIGYWFALHRDQLRTWWVVTILVVDLVLLGIFVVTFSQYSFGTPKTVRSMSAMTLPLVDTGLRQRLTPTELGIGESLALPGIAGHYDLVAPIDNPNLAWSAVEVRYRFTYGTAAREGRTVLWPGMHSYVTALNVVSQMAAELVKPSVEVLGVQWQRPEHTALFETEVNFPISQPSLNHASAVSGVRTTRYTAILKNDSVYSFRNVRFIVILRSGDLILAVGEVFVENFRSFEERIIELTWPQTLPLSAEATVIPALNLLDPKEYL